MLQDKDYELINDLWTLRDREDLKHDCINYVESNFRKKPLVVLVIDFLQLAVSMNGLSSKNLDMMYEDSLQFEECTNEY
tara:strand:+ start:660 stop:896 length:237 start_codon:yes stop_codon:yes gene_type:complete